MATGQNGWTKMRAFLRTLCRELRGNKLLRDIRGNTIAIMTAAVIPLAGMVGGGVDLTRMYIVKTRLQHACDAGALAGRKAMGGGTWAQTVKVGSTNIANYPNNQAEEFFDGNYNSAAYGATGVTRSFSESAGKVTGVAQATVPMTLMRIFGRTTETLNVTCDAEMRLPNTDVMFVLDTTGSMDSDAGSGQTRIQALRVAVKCFYEIVARLNTDATCTTGTPSGGTGSQVQIRFGFVPYSSNVNVGKLLKTDWMANNWNYQSRSPIMKTTTTNGQGSWVQSGSPSVTTENVTYTGVAQANCNDTAAASLNSHNESVNGNNKTVTDVAYDAQSWSSASGGTCRGTKTTTRTNYTWQTGQPVTTTTFDKWHYAKVSLPVSGLKNGTAWNTSLQLPLGTSGTNRTLSWDGCIEERRTVKQTSYDPIPANADDLDIDATPSQSDPNSLWGPALYSAIYPRKRTSSSNRNSSTADWDTADWDTTTDVVNNTSYACPSEARKLQAWPDADDFDDYVDALDPNGTTYHDIGLLWGARLMSPTGLFKSENEYTPTGGEIERHLIFMTDGTTNANTEDYNAYGVPFFDYRQTAANPSKSQLDDQVNARFSALCTAIKNKNITLWVIGFGDEISASASTQTRLTNCASSGRYFLATNATTLQSTFKSIADQISQLRLTN